MVSGQCGMWSAECGAYRTLVARFAARCLSIPPASCCGATGPCARDSRSLGHPPAPRAVRHDRGLAGGEAPPRGRRGRHRPRRRRARLRDPGDPRRGGAQGHSGGQDQVPGQRGHPRAAVRGGDALVAVRRRPAGERRSHRGLQRLQTVAVQRVLHRLRSRRRGGDPGGGVGVVPADRAPRARAAGADPGRPGGGAQGGRARARANAPRRDRTDSQLAVQPDRLRLHPRRAQGPRDVGEGAPHLGDRRRNLPAHPLWDGPGPVVPGSPRRVPRAGDRHLRRQQGLCDDGLADRPGLGAGRGRESDGGVAVTHHDRRQPPRAIRRGGGAVRSPRRGGRGPHGRRVPAPPGPGRRALPAGAIALVLGAGALWAQGSPVRPRLAAEADTNDWQAYFDYGVEQLQRVPGRADAAFYWAGRLDPWRSEPFYGRWVTFWMRHDGDWADYLAENPRILRNPEVRRADSLLLAALVRNPLTGRRLEALVYHSVPGEWGHDLATEGYIAYADSRYGDAVKVWGRLVLQDSVRNE